MIKRLGLFCAALGALLLAAAAGFMIYNLAEADRAAQASREILPKLMRSIPDSTGPSDAENAAKTEIDGNEYIGCLSVPALDLQLPVMSDWDYSRLKIAPCRYYGSAQTGDLVIAGHNYDSHFGRLSQLKPSDIVRFTSADGCVYSYRVRKLENLPPTATEEMIASGWDLSLYTCTFSGEERVTVRCEQIKNKKDNNK